MLENAKAMECMGKYNKEYKMLKDTEQNILYVHVLAGHGVQYGGQQSLLVNEFDKRACFY